MERKQTFWTVILVVHKITTTPKGELVTAEQDTELFNSANYSIWVTTCLFRDGNLATGVPHYSERSLCVLSQCRGSLVCIKLSKTYGRPLSRATRRLNTVTLRVVRTTHALLRAIRRQNVPQHCLTVGKFRLQTSVRIPAILHQISLVFLSPSRKSETSILPQSSDGYRVPNSLPGVLYEVKKNA
jgi:hypothetical protein